MENIFEVVQAIVVGLFVATFLLNTNRVLKAMELCRECLILLNNKALNKEEEFLKKLCIPIYSVIFKGYDIIKSDLTSTIESSYIVGGTRAFFSKCSVTKPNYISTFHLMEIIYGFFCGV